MWMLMNEAEDKTSSGTCSTTAEMTLRSFVDDVGALVKSIDPNHLLTLGTTGMGACGTRDITQSYREYQMVYASPYLDVCEYHDYNQQTNPMPANLSGDLSDCNALNKPMIVGESGIFQGSNRPSLFDAKMSAARSAGVSGYLPWDYAAAGETLGTESYNIRDNDPVFPVLAKYGDMTPPQTSLLIPSAGASVSGSQVLLDASASDNIGVTKVGFHLSGNGISDQIIATGTPTLYGWLAQWNSTIVGNGSYNVWSVAYDAAGDSGRSSPISLTVSN